MEAEAPILWPPDVNSWLIGKDPDVRKDWRQEEKGITEDEMVGWHHQLDGHEFEQAPGIGDGQGSLVCCSLWGRRVRYNWVTKLNWTELNWIRINNTKNTFQGCPGSSVVKILPANAGDPDSIPGSRRSPREGNGNPLQYFCLGNPIDRSLADYSPCGHKRDTT